jgi:hypothetical protein
MNYNDTILLDVINEVKPFVQSQWETIADVYRSRAQEDRRRKPELIRRHYKKIMKALIRNKHKNKNDLRSSYKIRPHHIGGLEGPSSSSTRPSTVQHSEVPARVNPNSNEDEGNMYMGDFDHDDGSIHGEMEEDSIPSSDEQPNDSPAIAASAAVSQPLAPQTTLTSPPSKPQFSPQLPTQSMSSSSSVPFPASLSFPTAPFPAMQSNVEPTLPSVPLATTTTTAPAVSLHPPSKKELLHAIFQQNQLTISLIEQHMSIQNYCSALPQQSMYPRVIETIKESNFTLFKQQMNAQKANITTLYQQWK